MALANVIPEVWRKTVLAGLRKDLPFMKVANTRFREEVWGQGDTLHILSLGNLTAQDYAAGNITYEDPSDATSDLLINLDRYVAFKNEDSVKATSDVNYLSELLIDAGYQIGDYFDQRGMAEYANAGLDSFEDGVSTAWQFTADTAANIPAFYASIRRKLKGANAPAGQQFVIGTPEVEEATLLYYGGKLASDKADQVVSNGLIGNFFGVNLYVSNNCVNDSSVDHGLAGVEGTSIAMATDIITDEGIRLEGRIADGYRMLGIGGLKTYRPEISIDVNLNEVTIATS